MIGMYGLAHAPVDELDELSAGVSAAGALPFAGPSGEVVPLPRLHASMEKVRSPAAIRQDALFLFMFFSLPLFDKSFLQNLSIASDKDETSNLGRKRDETINCSAFFWWGSIHLFDPLGAL